MGKQVKRVLKKPEAPIDVQSDDDFSSEDPEFKVDETMDDRDVDVTMEDDQSIIDQTQPTQPASSRKSKKRSRSVKNRPIKKSNKKRRARSQREPTDSSDFQSGYSSNYSDEYDSIKI